jgi:hypothetical protein
MCPQEVIDSYLNGGYISMRSIDNLIDTKNCTSPSFKILSDTYFTLSNKYYKELEFYYNNVDVNSDNGIMFESMQNNTFYQMNNIKESLDLRTPADGNFIS